MGRQKKKKNDVKKLLLLKKNVVYILITYAPAEIINIFFTFLSVSWEFFLSQCIQNVIQELVTSVSY